MKFPSVLSALALCAGLNLFAQSPTPPPEYLEFQKAMAITDVSARIKELQRIKAAYPNSEVASLFDSGLLRAMTDAAN
ncbi:MAG: hypothetical protein LBH03_00385, partial [Holophagales bacterium]|nr:hypothetical protein [Holophagales bacterium]